MICRRSGRTSPSATPSTTGGSTPQIDERAHAWASGLRLLLFSTRQSALSSEPPESLAIFREHQRLQMAERQLLSAPFHLPTCQLQSKLNLLRMIDAVERRKFTWPLTGLHGPAVVGSAGFAHLSLSRALPSGPRH